MKVIEGIAVSSFAKERLQIRFDETTGLIVETGNLGVPKDKVDYWFGDECLLFAGMGDVHIHAREDVSGKNNYKEDFTSAFAAMKNGGLVHAGDMPNNPVPPVDQASYEAKFLLATQKAQGCLWTYAGIGPETRPLPYPVPYKVYMGPSIGELFFRDLKSLDETLKHYQGQCVSFHCEDPEILEQHKNDKTHPLRRPPSAEVMATKDALMLIEKYSLKGKLCHYSTGEGMDLIRAARARGVNVSIEVTPQHLYFDLEHIPAAEETFFQMNPPIREKMDRLSMLSAVKTGEIDFLATDHAPHTLEEKRKGTSGLTGLDTFAPFTTWLMQQGLAPESIAKMACENPGDFYNHFLPSWKRIDPALARMGNGVGYLRAGFRANFTVLDLKTPYTVTAESLKTKVGHGPFVGVTFPGCLRSLFIGGQRV